MNYQDLIDLLKADRSCRRFDESAEVGRDNLLKIIDAARYCPSGRNLQPLVYRTVYEPAEREAIFPLLGWAGYLTDWAGPEEGERPAAYLVQCLDTALTRDPMCDDGLQLEAVTLAATALGFNCCVIKSFNPQKTAERLGIPPRYTPIYIVAIGKAAERFSLDTLAEGSRDRAIASAAPAPAPSALAGCASAVASESPSAAPEKPAPVKIDEIKYWRDPSGLHHVPKRPLADLLI